MGFPEIFMMEESCSIRGCGDPVRWGEMGGYRPSRVYCHQHALAAGLWSPAEIKKSEVPSWFGKALAKAQHQDTITGWPWWKRLGHKLLVGRRCPRCIDARGPHEK